MRDAEGLGRGDKKKTLLANGLLLSLSMLHLLLLLLVVVLLLQPLHLLVLVLLILMLLPLLALFAALEFEPAIQHKLLHCLAGPANASLRQHLSSDKS